MFEARIDNSGDRRRRASPTARRASSPSGASPTTEPGFRGAVEIRYPEGEDDAPGATTVWMRTVAAAARTRRCRRSSASARSPTAATRSAATPSPTEVQFVNTDLLIALHRDPVGEWLGSRATSAWQPTGIGLAEALLFDDEGPVGRALQTLLLRPAPPS